MENTFNDIAFLTLTKENQEKVECIYSIAMVLHTHHAPNLTAQEFDELYDKPLNELMLLSGYFSRRSELYMRYGV